MKHRKRNGAAGSLSTRQAGWTRDSNNKPIKFKDGERQKPGSQNPHKQL